MSPGPATSCRGEMGTTPTPLTTPSEGLKPTSPFTAAGERIEPSVSVPTAAAQRLKAAAVPDPELEPEGLRRTS